MSSYLEEKIKYYDEEYMAGRALIDDTQFDQLEKNLLRIDPDCDYFTHKKELSLPSLPKDNIQEFLEGLLPTTRLLIQAKIDDFAIAIKYVNGKLEKAISRKGQMLQTKLNKSKTYQKKSRLDQVLWFVENYLPNKKHRTTRKELHLDTLEAVNINLIQKLASARSKSSTPEPTNTKVSFTVGNWALPYLNLLKRTGILK